MPIKKGAEFQVYVWGNEKILLLVVVVVVVAVNAYIAFTHY